MVASGAGYLVGWPPSATGSITDNEGTPSVSIAATNAAGAEQGPDPIIFTVTRSGNAFTGGTLSANGQQLTLTAARRPRR